MTEKQTSKGAVFSILDPRGIKPEWEVIPLTAPRPDTLKGKTVYVFGFEGFPQLMPEVAKIVPEFAPGVNVVYWEDSERSGRGSALVKDKLVEEMVKNADAAIVGNGF